jgi:hypothetical protein
MRRIIPFILALVALMATGFAALAQEPAKYNFASVQGEKNIRVLPGGEGAGSMYFYNIDGNRITHITLEVTQSPPGWQVEIQPPLAEIQVEITGQVVTVTENLYVEPSKVQSQEIKKVSEGMVCIPVAGRGFALGKEARIIARPPPSEKIGTKGELTVSAIAQWLGQGGAIAFNQKRDFNFTVEIVPEEVEYQEKILGNSNGFLDKWIPVIIGVAVVAIGATVILLYRRRRRE